MKNTDSIGYFAKDVASDLEITTSTLRRWSLELEKSGYTFERNDQKQRIYYERDFKAFRKMKDLLSNNLSFENAVHAVISMSQTLSQTHSVQIQNEDELRLSKRELQEIVQAAVKQAIEDEKEALLKAIENKMNNVIEQRDRYLTQELHRSLEQKQLEIAAAAEPEKKSWLKRLFKG